MTLQEIGIKHNTDKATLHFFLDGYEKFLISCDIQVKVLVEMGIWEGGSLRMWSEYFPYAEVIGLDFDAAKCFSEDNIKCYVADQNRPETILDALVGKDVDLFIDDGGHMMTQQIDTFNTVWPTLKKGAVYILEDLHTSYDRHYINHDVLAIDFIQKFVEDNEVKYSLINNNNGKSISIIMQK